VLKSLRPLVVALAPGQARSLGKLKVMREELSNELAVIINEYGPKLYEDFDQWRILVPSASVPPSSGKPGLWRRKSGIGAVDAQGNLLVHPMTWIDERLFGWSRSATRGTSAWAGPSRSQEISRVATPDGSDDEDSGDYDNVLGYLPVYEGRPKTPLRSGSFADLQKLRMTAVDGGNAHSSVEVNHSPIDGDALFLRRHRSRKHSLSDSVPVERISASDDEKEFKNVTNDINREIQEKKKVHRD